LLSQKGQYADATIYGDGFDVGDLADDLETH
jgi:hypothetical protein